MLKLPQSFKPILLAIALVGTGMLYGQNSPETYTTLKDGKFEDVQIWTNAAAGARSCNCAPGCAINDDQVISIVHKIESDCHSIGVYGESRFQIIQGAELVVQGNLDVYGDAELRIDSDSKLTVEGDLTISGSSELILDGELKVLGNVNVIGNGISCGTGMATVSGSVAGEGWCLELMIQPILINEFESQLVENENIQLSWNAEGRTNHIEYVIARSDNGMTFTEIARFSDPTMSQLEFTDLQVGEGTHYYRLGVLDQAGAEVHVEFTTISVALKAAGLCELVVEPNPCVPSCFATLVDCPSGQYKTTVLDASGQLVSQVFPIAQSDSRIQYHINKQNLLMPGVYIIKAQGSKASKSKKVIIK